MNSRDNHLWLQTWKDKQTDFHQENVNPLLIRFWPKLKLPPGCRIFVPLCGKSLDMIWLANQGHNVIGVELSPIAVQAFFQENHLKPVKQTMGQFTLWQHDRISILCGDYFSLTRGDLGHIDTVYDRASLTALPEDIRKHYVIQLKSILPETAEIFLLTTEDAEEGDTLQHAMGVDEEIAELYSDEFDIDLAHVESVWEGDPDSLKKQQKRTEYKLYQLTSRLNAF